MKLSKADKGVRAEVKKVEVSPAERNRLAALGIAEGLEVIPERSSAFGSSILVRAGVVRVVLRTELADKIEVEPK